MSAGFRPPRVAPAALPFQGDLDRLIAEPAPLTLRAWPVLGAGLLAALVGVASILPLDIVVSAGGELAADAPPVVLKPMSRAVLAELFVRPGDRVRSGQVLARLDPTLPEADRATLQAERDSVAAQIARAEAELSGTPLPEGSAENALQGPVLASRFDMARARRARLSEAVSALEQTLAAFQAQTSALEEQLKIATELEVSRSDLASRQLVPATEALAARSARLAAESELAAHRGRLAELHRALSDARSEATEFDLALRQESTESLPPLRLRLAQLDDVSHPPKIGQ